MTPEQIDAFLREPHITTIATIGPDGSPHVTPVWHHYDGEKVYVLVEQSAVKLRNIRRDSRVSLCIATDEEPYKYVLVSGTTTVSGERIPELVRAMAVNYLGPERGEEYTREALAETEFALITVTPSKIIGWDGD